MKKIKEFAIKHNVPIIRDKELSFIRQYITDNNTMNILEIGTAIGYSSLCFASVSPYIKIDTIEYNINMYNQAKEFIGDNKQIRHFFGNCLEINNNLLGKYDLIFLDGPKSSLITQFEKFYPLLNEGGTVFVDNIFLKVIRNDPDQMSNKRKRRLVEKIDSFIDYISKRDDLFIEIYDLDDGLAMIKRREHENSNLST